MHGGDIYRNNIELDFSVNVNPMGVPKTVISAMEQGIREIMHYPDITCEKLKDEIVRQNRGIFSERQILCGNGASELLMAIVHALNPKKALLVAPGFFGYEHSLQAVSCEIVRWYAREDKNFSYDGELFQAIKANHPNLVMVANPSNPVGNLMDREFVHALAEVCEKAGSFLILDECFMELTGQAAECSMIYDLSTYPKLLLLRAFTKSFAIPGIRLGYLLGGDIELMKKIAIQLPEWNVSVPAQLAGIACMKETAYLEQSVQIIEEQRIFLTKELERLGFTVYPSHTNYILFQWKNRDSDLGMNLFEKLLEVRILIRDCSDYQGLAKGFYRIAVKRSEENIRLIEELKRILEN